MPNVFMKDFYDSYVITTIMRKVRNYIFTLYKNTSTVFSGIISASVHTPRKYTSPRTYRFEE